MSEAAKTCVFVLAGALAISSAVFFNTQSRPPDVRKLVGTVLNKDIDVDAPRRLEISKFDRATASVRQFEVAEVDGVWSIPSKENYPADAVQQMAEAATCLFDRKILRVAGESAEKHQEFGVVDPLSSKLDSKSVGVGTHVKMLDADDAPLVDMIIGKAVKDNPTQRYVRAAMQDVVYVVELDPTKLSTNFSDWIEADLLKLSAMDLRKIFVNDYSADLSLGVGAGGRPVLQVARERRNEMTLDRTADGSPWVMEKILKEDDAQQGMIEDKLAEDEEVNQEAVNALVTGLDDLAIVDVARKPEGLSADLKAGEGFLNEEEAISDLMGKGFIPNPEQKTGAELLSSEGEVVCTQRNGVEYVLRFGQLQVSTDAAATGDQEEDSADAPAEGAATPAEGEAADTADAEKEDEGANLRRYLFVMARFNEDAVEKPVYKELPPLPAEETAEADEAGDAEDAAAADESAEDAADAAADAPAEGEAEGEAAADAADDKPDDEKPAADAEREKIEAERKQIEEDNDRVREEYESLISSGQEEVAALNARFGDWYFVISNDVFKKIHLGRDQVVKKKAPPAAEGEGAEAPSATSGLPGLEGLGIPSAPPTSTP